MSSTSSRSRPTSCCWPAAPTAATARSCCHNAAALGASALACPMVLAGNRNAADEAVSLLVAHGRGHRLRERDAGIQRARRRTGARGDPARLHRPHRPRQGHRSRAGRVRPGADADAGRRASKARGCSPTAAPERRASVRCWSSIRAARRPTSIRSPTASRRCAGVIPQGLPEPRVKRTVEGDLGMRHNAATIVEAVGVDAIAADAGSRDAARCRPARQDHPRRRAPAAEHRGDRARPGARLRRGAPGRRAPLRHRRDRLYRDRPGDRPARQGPVRVDVVIGTGGALVHSRDPGAVLRKTLASAGRSRFRCGRGSRSSCSTANTCLYACGLLGAVEPQAAFELALAHLEPIDSEIRMNAPAAPERAPPDALRGANRRRPFADMREANLARWPIGRRRRLRRGGRAAQGAAAAQAARLGDAAKRSRSGAASRSRAAASARSRCIAR